MTFGVEHAGRDLVTHLYPFGCNADILQVTHHRVGVSVEGLFKFIERHLFPCLRLVLFARVSPAVAVVEVDHHTHAPFLGTPGHVDGLRGAAVAAVRVVGRIHPGAQADGVDAVVLQDLETILLFSFVVAEGVTTRLHLRQPTDIGSFCEGGIGFLHIRGTAAGEQKHQGGEDEKIKIFHCL